MQITCERRSLAFFSWGLPSDLDFIDFLWHSFRFQRFSPMVFCMAFFRIRIFAADRKLINICFQVLKTEQILFRRADNDQYLSGD